MKTRMYTMRVTDDWLQSLFELTETMNNQTYLGLRARELSYPKLTVYDVIQLAVQATWMIEPPQPEIGTKPLHKLPGFDKSGHAHEAVRRLRYEVRLKTFSGQPRARAHLTIIQGGVAS